MLVFGISLSKFKEVIAMTMTPLIDAKLAQISEAIAKERTEFVSAVAKAVAPLTDEITALKTAIADLKMQVEVGSAAQATLIALEAGVVAGLERVAADVDTIVVEPVAEPEFPA